ncbi:MAG: FxLYD domain-containing protein [Nanoarchaeota archaeon]
MKKDVEVSEKMIHISAKNFSYAVIGVIIVALLIVGYVVMNSGDKTKTDDTTNIPADETPITDTPVTEIPVVENTDKVVILSDTMDIDNANDRHKTISGRVQNTGTDRALNVWVTAFLYNLNGTQVGKETTRPLFNELNPNEISYFYINVYDDVTASYRLSVSSE